MNESYTIKELCHLSNISQATFYRLIADDKEFRELTQSKREKIGNGYRYDSAVLEWLYHRYNIKQTPEMPLEAPAELAEKPDYLAKITALEGEIEALTATITQKDKDIEYLKNQNDQLLLLLQMEKQEKIALLPAPKKSFVERMRTLFTKDKDKEKKAPSE